MNFLFYRET